jgi:hypothetical protein
MPDALFKSGKTSLVITADRRRQPNADPEVQLR